VHEVQHVRLIFACHAPQLSAMQGARQMCQAMFRLAVGLQMIGQLPGPAAPYNSEEQRFEQRFMVYFPQTSPQHLDYLQFEEAMNVKGAHDPQQ